MTSPLVMMESDYTRPVAFRAIRNWVNDFKAVVAEPSNPPRAPHGGQGADPLRGLKERWRLPRRWKLRIRRRKRGRDDRL